MWTGYVPVTILGAQVAENLTDFPVYISGAGLPDAFWLGRAAGEDITVTTTGNVVLPYELVHYDPASKAMELHVQLDLVAGTDQTVRLWYGNGAFGTSKAAPTSVWDSNFVGVWHMPGGTGNAADSTSHGLTATDNVSQTGGDGYLYASGGQQFDNNDYLNVADNALLDITSAITIEGWYNPTSAAGAIQFLSLRASTYYLSIGSTDAKLYGYVYQSGAPKTSSTAAGTVQNGWQHLAMTWDRTDGVRKVKLYRNGAPITPASSTAAADADIDNTANPFRIGYSSNSLVGYADEIRLSNVSRSAGWLLTQYRNHSSPATFYSVGTAVRKWDPMRLLSQGVGVTTV